MGKRVFITGGTGFIGRELIAALRERDDEIVALTRDPTQAHARALSGDGVTLVEGDSTLSGDWQKQMAGCDAVINLAGQPLAGKRWDAHYKQLIHDSRVETTRYVVEGIAALDEGERPAVLVSASGVDYYPFGVDLDAAAAGDEDDDVAESTPPGSSLLARVCRNWELEARRANQYGVRVAYMRMGIVLGSEGALNQIATPFKLFVGGRLGSGRQWMSWIHVADAVRGYLYAVDEKPVSGPLNLCAPKPVRAAEFAGAMGRALDRPSWLPAPGFAIRAAVGEFAEYILNGRRAVPAALLEHGFEFRYPDLDAALAAIYG